MAFEESAPEPSSGRLPAVPKRTKAPQEMSRIFSGALCPACDSPDSAVKDSRPVYRGIRRRRSCNRCGHRWTTYEVAGEFEDVIRLDQMLQQLEEPDLQLLREIVKVMRARAKRS